MANFQPCRGNETNLPSQKTDGFTYFCLDSGGIYVDYKNQSGELDRKRFGSLSKSVIYSDSPPANLSPIMSDGVTDDTNAFQAMIDYCAYNGGGVIQLSPGIVKITRKIMWKDGVSLIGAGMGITTIRPEGGGYSAIDFDETGGVGSGENRDEPMFHNITFKDFGIDGGLMSANGNPVGTKGIFLVYMERCVFQNLLIQNTIGTGLGVDFLRDCLIDNVHTINCGYQWTTGGLGQAGIGIGTGGMPKESMIIRDCVAESCGSFGIFVELQEFSDGRTQHTSQKAVIINCVANNGLNDGFNIYHGEDIAICNCRAAGNARHGFSYSGRGSQSKICDCLSYNNARDGILVYSPNSEQRKDNIHITRNVCHNNGQNGINIDSDGDDVAQHSLMVNGNVCYDNTLSGVRAGSLGTSDYMQINHNTCYGNGQNGITHNLSGSWQQIVGNECYDNGHAGNSTMNDGLWLGGEHAEFVVNDNILHDNPVGIRLSSSAVITGGSKYNNIVESNATSEISGGSWTGLHNGSESALAISCVNMPDTWVVGSPIPIRAMVSSNASGVAIYDTNTQAGYAQSNASLTPGVGGQNYTSNLTFDNAGTRYLTLYARDVGGNRSEYGIDVVIKITSS